VLTKVLHPRIPYENSKLDRDLSSLHLVGRAKTGHLLLRVAKNSQLDVIRAQVMIVSLPSAS